MVQQQPIAMPRFGFSILALGSLVALAAAQTAPQYGQCGGIGWSGPTTCPANWYCNKQNDYYSQCIPGTVTTTTTPGGGGPTTTTSGSSGTATLVSGNSWIRAVADPNFHKYLQSEVVGTASDAVLGSPTTAGQFQITNGQLVQKASSGDLYAIVETPADSTVKKLRVTWSKTPATSGKFVFSGDTVEWSSPTVTRPQNNAWLVCPDGTGHSDVFINLGPYGYQTPAGCADQTIHGYTGATANN